MKARPELRIRPRRRRGVRVCACGEHLTIALRRGLGIGDADHLAQFDREIDPALHVTAAFGAVAFQDVLFQAAAQHPVDRQARPAKSRMPLHIPCPANGGVR